MIISKSKNPKAQALKKLIGPSWASDLGKLTGLSLQAVRDMVNSMNVHHEHWHHVMALAAEGKKKFEEVDQLTENIAA